MPFQFLTNDHKKYLEASKNRISMAAIPIRQCQHPPESLSISASAVVACLTSKMAIISRMLVIARLVFVFILCKLSTRKCSFS